MLQDIYGLSPQAFSFAFGANGLGLVAGEPGQRAPRRAATAPRYLLRRALLVIAAAAAALLAVVADRRLSASGL